jgi:hypothetical protein
MPDAYVVDSNLLVLLVVGTVDRELIDDHRRLQRFTRSDYDTLVDLLDEADRIVLTPDTLTETSNLLGFHKGTEREDLFDCLELIIEEMSELIIPSKVAIRHAPFVDVGLTDAVLLNLISAAWPLVTVDLELFRLARRADPESAINFTAMMDFQNAVRGTD